MLDMLKSMREFANSMAGRQFFILTVGLVVAATLALGVADLKQQADFSRARIETTANRVGVIARFLDTADQEHRRDMRISRGANIRFADSLAEQEVDGHSDDLLVSLLKLEFEDERNLTAKQVSPDLCHRSSSRGARPIEDALEQGREIEMDRGPSPVCWLVSFDLADGERVSLFQRAPPALSFYSRFINPAYIAVLILASALLAFFVSRVSTAPLHHLAKAATELGSDLDREPMGETGPVEVRAAAQAFNLMQTRLQHTLRERTQMLAAITHDLQTPLTRMRLRVENAPEDIRERLISDISAMQGLISDGLELARATEVQEEAILLDLNSLLESLVEDAADVGHDASFSGGCEVDINVQAQSLRRCLSNLIENAIQHGGSAEVRCARDKAGLSILIRDQGPGIPEDQLELMFEPFTRLEESRSRETGGTGLGLAISKALAKQIGAVLTLANRPEGGLEARLFLPASMVRRQA